MGMILFLLLNLKQILQRSSTHIYKLNKGDHFLFLIKRRLLTAIAVRIRLFFKQTR